MLVQMQLVTNVYTRKSANVQAGHSHPGNHKVKKYVPGINKKNWSENKDKTKTKWLLKQYTVAKILHKLWIESQLLIISEFLIPDPVNKHYSALDESKLLHVTVHKKHVSIHT